MSAGYPLSGRWIFLHHVIRVLHHLASVVNWLGFTFNNMTHPLQYLEPQLVQYCMLQDMLISQRNKVFPIGTKVMVNCPGRYVGPGIASNDSSVPVSQCAVLLPNGNTWWYPLFEVTPIKV